MTTDLRLYSLDFRSQRAYLLAALFIACNVAVPQLCHLIPDGGKCFIPIYFFTLIGAYKYGWRVGLMTALLSPAVNCALFNMPAADSVLPITVKSVLLALAAGYAAARWRKASLLLLVGVVLFYQLIGSIAEWLISGSASAALSDIRMALPGMAIQVLGGWLVINKLTRRY